MTTFTYRGRELAYLDHPYNATRHNERAVEIPIAVDFITKQSGAGIELGDVLGHYTDAGPDAGPFLVVDLDENADGALTADVREWTPDEPLDWLVSISTIEHIGWDPPTGEVDPHAAPRLLDRIDQFTRGPMLVTVPLGYNPGLDVHLLDRPSCGSTMVTEDGYWWREEPGVVWLPYDSNTPRARAVWIGSFP